MYEGVEEVSLLVDLVAGVDVQRRLCHDERPKSQYKIRYTSS